MDKQSYFKVFCRQIGCSCQANFPMKEYTSFKIGGEAELFIQARNTKEVSAIMIKAQELAMPVTIVGKGSNLLVSDTGIPGIVLSLEEAADNPVLVDETIICCPAGVNLSRLCAFAMQNRLSGLEFAWGIPASVGGAVYMNAGAYGSEIKDVLSAVEYVDRYGTIKTTASNTLEYGYRKSWFMKNPGCLITNTIFRLKKGDQLKIREMMDGYMKSRKEKQPLDQPSAGSTFKRPSGAYAGELIEQCGLKGYQIGGAMVSKKHAGFIVNVDHASCEDVRRLIEEIQRRVNKMTGFSLECEVRML